MAKSNLQIRFNHSTPHFRLGYFDYLHAKLQKNPKFKRCQNPPETIAIFGATGKTGRETFKALLSPSTPQPIKLNIYIRSRLKLQIFPDLASNKHVEIYTGALTDGPLIKNFLIDAETIICALGENENVAGKRVL